MASAKSCRCIKIRLHMQGMDEKQHARDVDMQSFSVFLQKRSSPKNILFIDYETT